MIQFNLTTAADQQFGAILNGRRTTLRLRYNPSSERWSFDLSIDDQPVLLARRIVSGVDLLKPFKLGVGLLFALPIVDGAVPGRNELADGTVGLFHATEIEYNEAIST